MYRGYGHGRAAVLSSGVAGASPAPAPGTAGAGSGRHIPPWGDNLIRDGSFETPVTPRTFQLIRQGGTIGPWTVTRGNVFHVGRGIWKAADGVQTVTLNGSTEGTIAQTFATIPYTRYTLSYALAGDTQGPPWVKTGQVLVDGRVVQDFSFDTAGKSWRNMGWVTKHVTFLATGWTTTLSFASTTPGANGAVLDAVRVRSCLFSFCPAG